MKNTKRTTKTKKKTKNRKNSNKKKQTSHTLALNVNGTSDEYPPKVSIQYTHNIKNTTRTTETKMKMQNKNGNKKKQTCDPTLASNVKGTSEEYTPKVSNITQHNNAMHIKS